MSAVVKGFMLAGIGGTVSYAVINAVLTAMVTGTSAADLFILAVVPIVVAAGVVWLVVASAFKG